MAEENGVGGYEVNLLYEIDKSYICPYCSLVLRNPVQALCGQRMCVSCYKSLQSKKNKTFHCPICNEIHGLETVYPDRFSAREIHSLITACKYTKCPWTGEVQHFEAHLSDCTYVEIKCPNERCQEFLPRDALTEHIGNECKYRLTNCPHCKEAIVLADLTEVHFNECPGLKIKCPNGCTTEEFTKKELDTHLKECPRQKRECTFAFAGCNFMGCNDELMLHYEKYMTLHTGWAAEKCEELKKKYLNLEDRFMKTESTVADVTEKLITLSTLNKENSEKLGDIDEQQRIVIDDILNIRNTVTKIEEASEIGRPGSKLSILNELAVLKKTANLTERRLDLLERKIAEQQQFQGVDWTAGLLPSVVSSPWLSVKKQVENLDGVLAMQSIQIADLKMNLDLLEITSYNGSIVWKIEDIDRKRLDALKGRVTSLYSPPFYIGRFGYKACARIYLNGDGMAKGKFVSLFFTVMKGECDALLPWPFQQRVTFKIFNCVTGNHIVETFRPDPFSASFRRPQSGMNIASGCPYFAEQSVIFDNQNGSPYIKENSMYVEIRVDRAGLKLEC